LLIDTSGSTRRVLPDERHASYRFLEQVLREDKDLAFVIHFDFEVELLQDLTSSRQKLEKALGELETGYARPQWGRRGQPRGRGGSRGGTTMYDAVLLASDELMKKQTGRKALILLTDGVDIGSKVTLEQAVESAQRADTLVYSILFQDPQMAYVGMPAGGLGRGGWGRPVPRMEPRDGKKVLQEIARDTGGRFFEVGKRRPIQSVFAEIEEDLRNQYNLGYTPEGGDSSGGFRRIHLTTTRKGLSVQAREGYYPS
jgi:VWFA-related protein